MCSRFHVMFLLLVCSSTQKVEQILALLYNVAYFIMCVALRHNFRDEHFLVNVIFRVVNQVQIQVKVSNDSLDLHYGTCGPRFLQFPTHSFTSYLQLVLIYHLIHKNGRKLQKLLVPLVSTCKLKCLWLSDFTPRCGFSPNCCQCHDGSTQLCKDVFACCKTFPPLGVRGSNQIQYDNTFVHKVSSGWSGRTQWSCTDHLWYELK